MKDVYYDFKSKGGENNFKRCKRYDSWRNNWFIPDEKIKEAVKNVYDAAYKKGLMIGAYSISTIVLRKLKGSKNPALAVANTIKFLKSNKHIESYDKQQKEIIEKGF